MYYVHVFKLEITMPPKCSKRRRTTIPRFVTGDRPGDGTAQEVEKQPMRTGTEGYNTDSHTPNWRCSSSHVRILLPRYEYWYPYWHYGTGQLTNGVNCKCPLVLTQWIMLQGVSMLVNGVYPGLWYSRGFLVILLGVMKCSSGRRKATFKGDYEHTFMDHYIHCVHVSIPREIYRKSAEHAKMYVWYPPSCKQTWPRWLSKYDKQYRLSHKFE